MRREDPESSKQDPKFTGNNWSLPCRHFLSLLLCSIFFSSSLSPGLMSGVWFIRTCDSLCCSWWSTMNWSATVTCFMFAMPTLFWFLCDSAVSMCFLLLSCFVFFCRCALLMLCDRGFLCTLFPCMVQQQFGHFRACQRQINWLQAYFTSFKFVCGSMRRRGLLDSPSN